MPDPLAPVGVTLERAVQVTGCRTCHVKAGVPCKTPGGRVAPCHSTRYEDAKQYVYERVKLERWNRSAKGEG